MINDIGPDEESGSVRITGEAAAIPEAFGDLEEAWKYFRRTFRRVLNSRPKSSAPWRCHKYGRLQTGAMCGRWT